MRAFLLTLGVFVCSAMALLKIWGLIFVDFSAKQLVYTACFAAAASAMGKALSDTPESDAPD